MSVLTAAKSFLTRVGEEFRQGLTVFCKYAPTVVADAAKVEAAAQPFLTLAFPGISPEIAVVTNTIVAAALSTEQKFAAMGQQSGTGPQKLAEVLSIVGPSAEAALTKLGLLANEANVKGWIDSVVAFLNGIPVAPTPPVPA
jgi:hypothetical protein